MSSSTPHATNKPHTPDLRPPPPARTCDKMGQNGTLEDTDGPLKPQQFAPRLPSIPEKRDISGQSETLANANRVPDHEPTVPTPKISLETCDISGQSGTYDDTPHSSCRHLPLRRPTPRFRAEPRLSPWADLQVGDISGQNETRSDTPHPNSLPTRVTFRDMMGHAPTRRLRIPAPAHPGPARHFPNRRASTPSNPLSSRAATQKMSGHDRGGRSRWPVPTPGRPDLAARSQGRTVINRERTCDAYDRHSPREGLWGSSCSWRG